MMLGVPAPSAGVKSMNFQVAPPSFECPSIGALVVAAVSVT